MANTIIEKIALNARPTWSGDVPSGLHSGLTTGLFIGPDSSGNVALADNTASLLIPARGILIENARQTTTIGSNAHTLNQNRVEAFGKSIIMQDDDWSWTINKPMYLVSGGGMSQIRPNEQGFYRQIVGYAIAADKVEVDVGPAELIST